MALLYKVLNRCENHLPILKLLRLKPPAAKKISTVKSAIQKAVFSATGRRHPVTFIYNKTIASFLNRRDAGKLLAMGPLEPAEMVYVNGTPMWVDNPSSQAIAKNMKKLVRAGNKPVSAFLVKNVGLFIAANKKDAAIVKDFATGTTLVRIWASHFGGLVSLTKSEQAFVKRWYLAAPQPTKPHR